jgi:hypothetical protein
LLVEYKLSLRKSQDQLRKKTEEGVREGRGTMCREKVMSAVTC